MAKKLNISLSKPLVAIELGSNIVRALAAERTEQGQLRLLGYEQTDSKAGYMDRGVVAHSADAGYMISEVLRKLANRVGVDNLPSAFVCVGARPIQVAAMRKPDESEQDCRARIDQSNPHAAVMAVVGPSVFCTKREVMDQLVKSYDQSSRVIEASFVRSHALVKAFAAQDGQQAMEDGVAILDMGAETTTLTIYGQQNYHLARTIAYGSNHITRLIAQQGINPQLAERLKCEYGYAAPEQVERNLRMHIQSVLERGVELTVTSVELSELISLRLNEILSPLLELVRENASRVRTLYITGGGSMLRGLSRYLQTKVPMPVVYGAHNSTLVESSDPEYCSPRYSSLVGTLLLAADYRAEHKQVPERPTSMWTRLRQQAEQTALEIFTDTE